MAGGDAAPGVRPRRRADQGQEGGDLRHRPAYLQLGQMGGGDDPGADGGRPRISRRDRGGRARRDGAEGRPARLRRGSYRVRLLPQLPRRARPSVPQHQGRRRQPAGRLRRLYRDPRLQRLSDPRRDFRRGRRHSRSARQRRAHRAVVRPRRRGRADHRGRADRADGDPGLPSRRGAQHRHHRRQRLPPGAGRRDGRDARGARRSPEFWRR